jgi:FkbM family methyltransferase
MKKKLKSLSKSLLKTFDIGIIHYSALQKMQEKLEVYAATAYDMQFLLHQPEHSSLFLEYLRRSKSQLRQDLFVLSQLNFKRNGYFVEFGATNGVELSNTHLMEKEFDWTGILAEPAVCWHNDLKKNRSAHIETCCVWSESNKTLRFNEAEMAELSTIDSYCSSDGHYKQRESGKSYDVKTISLNDLLAKYDAPRKIDFLSLDTEGSEFAILNSFDFSKYDVNIISCEHNFTVKREQIYELLSKHKYVRIFEELSSFDDWYIKQS